MDIQEFYKRVDHLDTEVLHCRVKELKENRSPEIARGYQETLREIAELTKRESHKYRVSVWLENQINIAATVPIEPCIRVPSEASQGRKEAINDLTSLMKRDPDRNWMSLILQERLGISYESKTQVD